MASVVAAEEISKHGPRRTMRFANETGIHGLQPLLTSHHKRERAVWVAVLLVAACFMVKGIVASVFQYMDQPTVTHLSVISPEKLPDFMICDPFWASEEKMAKMGITGDEYEALGLAFMHGTAFTANYREVNYTAPLKSLLSKFGKMEIDELVRKVAFTAEEVIPRFKTFLGWGVGISSGVGLSITGACIRLTNTLPINYMFTQIPYYVRFNVTHRPPAFGRSYTKKTAPLLAVGEGVHSVYPESSIIIPLTSRVEVLVGMLKLKTAPKSNHDENCADWSKEAEKHCIHVQFNKVCVENNLKPFYVPNQNLTLSGVAVMDRRCFFQADAINDAIRKNCPRPCLRWLYDLSTTVTATTNSSSSWVNVAWRNPADTLFMEEINSMSWDTFLSNLGGQISLWSGASLLTLIHVLLFFACSYNNKG